MRILLSIHHNLNRNAGAPGATWRLAQAYHSLGHEVDILSFDTMEGPEALKRFLFPLYIVSEIARRPAYDVYDLSSGDGWIVSWLRKFVCKNSRSLIVARSHGLEHVLHEALVKEARKTGTRLSWKYPLYNGGFLLWECQQSFAKADLVLLLNNSDQDYACTHLHVDRLRTRLVLNGIGDNFIEHAHQLALQPSEQVEPLNIAFIGSYIERKGIRFLREAMIDIMRQNQKVNLGFFGTGASPAEVIINDYPEDLRARITVTPYYNNQDLPHLLEGYHILAFPSLTEGLPLAPTEAAACGLVPIVSNIPGPLIMITHDKNGLVIPKEDASALRDAILQLIDTPELWRRLRKQGLSEIAKYSWTTIAADTLKLYQSFLEKPHYPAQLKADSDIG